MSGKRIRQLIAVAIIFAAIIYGFITSRNSEQHFAWPLATCSSGETVTNVFAQRSRSTQTARWEQTLS